jgi:glycosyltransferase involved in cell wall biosynthesis
MKPLLSIITAARNASKTIAHTINSLREQSERNFEHIIIDGASTDGTQDIIGSFQKAYPLVWLSEPDLGIADAMNKGFSISQGQYILCLHADDRLFDRHRIANAISAVRRGDQDIYAAPVLREYQDGRQELLKPFRPLWWYHFKIPFRHQGTLVHRRVFKRIGLFNTRYAIAMDYDFFYRALQIKPSIIYERHPLAIMGADGIGSRKSTTLKRLDEEFSVQTSNEANPFWKVVQLVYRSVYRPYKKGVIASGRKAPS